MNRYDERYEIRMAKDMDIENIMQFIDKYWKKGHIMSCDREYFEYEFKEKNTVNFIIAIDKSTGNIEAILGFLKSSHTQGKVDIWGSIWKVNDSHHNEPLLGIELQKRVDKLAGCRYHNGIGINPHTALPLMRMFFRRNVGKMNQYYMLNENLKEYRIAQINQKIVKEINQEEALILIPINSFEELINRYSIGEHNKKAIPYKDEWYVQKKFFSNPRRKYMVYGIVKSLTDKKIKGFIVLRECSYQGSSVLRILDYYGKQENFGRIGGALHDMILANHYEYVDLYTLGFEEKYIQQAGFVKREENSVNIIPNYFEPFEKKNIDIYVQYENENTVFFKADGDQDRCNYYEVTVDE